MVWCLGWREDGVLPSKLNTLLDVATVEVTVTPTVPLAKFPGVPMHAIAVADTQLLVKQSTMATVLVGVGFLNAKFKPNSEEHAKPEAGRLYGTPADTTGAAQEAS